MTVSQADKAKKFRALHEASGAFVIPNPWDGGSARVLAGLGFEALGVIRAGHSPPIVPMLRRAR